MNGAAHAAADAVLPLEHSYAALPETFYARVEPTPVAAPQLLRLNRALAGSLGLEPANLASDEGIRVLAGNHIPTGASPIAMAYAGHQFGNFVPSLGDGRAVLLGEVLDRAGIRRDIHLKGAGRTPFSRMGDGRAALGPVLREYIVSEAMAGLGIPTTRALAALTTGEPVLRDGPEPGAILVRVATSHVRVGTFEYFHRRGHHESVRELADYVIARHFPECAGAQNPYLALLEQVIERQAALIARWLLVGFIHGVMNTDNTSVVGETIDYGPCAFLDEYQPGKVFSSIDHAGRYAYDQQPSVGLWNLVQLAQCLLPLLDADEEGALQTARDALDAYAPAFQRSYHAGLRAKLGLAEERDGDLELALDLLRCLAEQRTDFTNAFRHLCDATDAKGQGPLLDLFQDPQAVEPWLARWRERSAAEMGTPRLQREAMRTVNPAYIPRNHRVQQAIDAATREPRDLQPLEELLTVVARPFEDHPSLTRFTAAPRPEEVVHRTFCGT